MDIQTKTVTTKTHVGIFPADAVRSAAQGAALTAAQAQLGLADAAILSKVATFGDDGSVKVEIVEQVSDVLPAPADTAQPGLAEAADAAPAVPPVVTPPAPGIVPGFTKAA